jgi:AGZA family xanthine/uracil permease-like MFS transporter
MEQSSIKTEVLAGISTFLATMYIIVVNPAILSQAGMSYNAVLTSTVLLSFFSSLMMGIYAKNPIVVAPGMGMNAFFTFTAVKGMGMTYQTALGAVFWAGVFFLVLSVFNIRSQISKAIPQSLRYAISAGIGLFIAFIGFQNAHVIIDNPATLVGMSSFRDPMGITFWIGLVIMTTLVVKQWKGGIIIGILVISLMAFPIGRLWGDASAVNFGSKTLINFTGFFSQPDFSLIGSLDILGSLKFSFIPVIFAFAFTDMFDSLSTFLGLAEAAGLYDESGEPRNVKKSLVTDAFSTLFSGILGTSPGTAYIESAVGIEQGGRTGLTAIVAGLLFLPFMFLGPVISLIPSIATAPALIIVGVFMIKPIAKIDWSNLEEAVPCFLAFVLIPFSYSITQGIILGFIFWVLMKVIFAKHREISPALWIICLFSLIFLIYGH